MHWMLEFMKQVLPRLDSPTMPFFAALDLPLLSMPLMASSYCAEH